MKRFSGLVMGFVLAGCACLSSAQVPTKIADGVLADTAGMTLYAFDKDVANSGKSVCNGPCGAGLISPPPSFVPTFCPNCCGTNPAVSTYASNLSGGVTVGSGGVTSCTLDFSGAGFVNSPTCYFFPLVTATPSPIYITSGSGNAAVTFTAGSTDMSSVRISYQCSGTLADATWYPVSQ